MSYAGVAKLAEPPPLETSGGTWKDHAACRGINHFTERTVPQQLAICRGGADGTGHETTPCPVIAQCLELGLQQPLHISGRVDFVFGAVDPQELYRLQKRRRLADGTPP